MEIVTLVEGAELDNNIRTSIDYPVFRTIKYSGNKTRLLPAITAIIKLAVKDGGCLVDLMAGTHSVGYALKKNFKICANDVQTYSYVIGKALVENGGYSMQTEMAKAELLCKIKENKITGKCNLFQKIYSDTYFSRRQCCEIDNIRAAIETVPSPRKEFYLTVLMASMCYAGNTTGHFAEYLHKKKPKPSSVQDLFFKKCAISIAPSMYSNCIFNLTYENFLSGTNSKTSEIMSNCDLIYLDPPYSSAQYSRFYHLLETLVKYDYPLVEYKGKYRQDRYFSNFCRKSKARSELDFLLRKCCGMNGFVLLSYVNSPSCLIQKNEATETVKNYFDYSTKPITCTVAHSKLGNGSANRVEEYLILATNSKPGEKVIEKLNSCRLSVQ